MNQKKAKPEKSIKLTPRVLEIGLEALRFKLTKFDSEWRQEFLQDGTLLYPKEKNGESDL